MISVLKRTVKLVYLSGIFVTLSFYGSNYGSQTLMAPDRVYHSLSDVLRTDVFWLENWRGFVVKGMIINRKSYLYNYVVFQTFYSLPALSSASSVKYFALDFHSHIFYYSFLFYCKQFSKCSWSDEGVCIENNYACGYNQHFSSFQTVLSTNQKSSNILKNKTNIFGLFKLSVIISEEHGQYP